MNKYYAVSEYALKVWARQLEKGLFDSNLDETDRRYIAINNIIHNLKTVHLYCTEIPVEQMPEVTKMDLIKAIRPDFAFDTALPQQFLDDVKDKTGEYIPQHLIWDVDNHRPVALTEKGRTVLGIYSHITGLYNEGMDKS